MCVSFVWTCVCVCVCVCVCSIANRTVKAKAKAKEGVVLSLFSESRERGSGRGQGANVSKYSVLWLAFGSYRGGWGEKGEALARLLAAVEDTRHTIK